MSKEADEIKGLYFPVLDHGFVSLVDYMGNDEDVIRAARVSYGAGTKTVSTNRGLIRYLLRHRHTTPFEMVELKFHIKMPIFVARQLVRHRTASINEYSGRYSLMPMLFYTPDEQNFALQSKSNRQGRGEQADQLLYNRFVHDVKMIRADSSELYEQMVTDGVARELARIDLPLSMYTEWYWKIDLHNLLHFLGLRADSHAQWEIQQFANPIAGMVDRVAPLSAEAWADYRYSAITLSWQEIQLLSGLQRGDIVLAEQLLEASASLGMSDRELEEFDAKRKLIKEPKRQLEQFVLDISTARPPEFFEAEAKAATPKIDQK